MSNPIELIINGRDNSRAAFNSVSSSIAKIGSVAAGILASQVFTKLATGVIDFATSMVTEAREAALVQADLEAVLKSTGGVAGVTAEMVDKYSKAISENSKYTDEEVTQAQILLLTFDKIGKDVFPRATQMTADLAARFKMDLSSASIMLGKALNDPTKGLTALNKAGVSFTEIEKEAIIKMWEAGDAAGAQGMMMDIVAKQVEGAAESQVTAWDKLKHKFDNIKEDLGTKLLPTIDKLGGMLSDALDNPAVQAAIESLGTWLGETIPQALDDLTDTLEIIKGKFDAAFQTGNFNTIIQDVLRFGNQMLDGIEARVKAIDWTELSRKLVDAIKRIDWNTVGRLMGDGLKSALNIVWAIVGEIDWWNLFKAILDAFMNVIAGIMGTDWDAIQAQWMDNFAAMGQTVELLRAIAIQKFEALKAGVLGKISELRSNITGKLNEIKSAFTTAWNNIVSSANNLKTGLVNAVSAAVNAAKAAALGAVAGFTSLGSSIISSIITGLNSAKQQLINYLKAIISSLVTSILGGGTGGGNDHINAPPPGPVSPFRNLALSPVGVPVGMNANQVNNYYNAHIVIYNGQSEAGNKMRGLI